ncbi:MAG TPA: hypothetical protein VG498_20495 [Terriglobales bacterium]|nr:hypothetical protein [Terriglobales bacterium]
MTYQHRSKFTAYICLTVVCASVALCAQEAKPRSQSEAYKVEYVFSEWQDNKKINARTYTLLVRPMDKASLRLGSRVPIAVGIFAPGNTKENAIPTQFQYLDVGMNIDCVVEPLDSDVILSTTVEVNRLAPEQAKEVHPIVRQTKIQVRDLVPVGKPTVLSNADEVDGTGRFQIEAAVTKIR